MGDALALGDDEGRAKLRKASGSRTGAVIRRYPNGETRRVEDPSSLIGKSTRGTETSKYPEEKKTTVIPQVAASERGTAQTGTVKAVPGL